MEKTGFRQTHFIEDYEDFVAHLCMSFLEVPTTIGVESLGKIASENATRLLDRATNTDLLLEKKRVDAAAA